MIHLVQSIWLWAIAGILVPLFIHLWNIKKGKTLKVGSIAFLTDTARSHSKSLHISDWLLLTLRCLLLILLAVLLTSPFFEQQDNSVKEKGWILVEKQELAPAYKAFSTTIDSLLKSGYVLHYFNKGFPEGTFSDTATDANKKITDSASYWTRLREMDQQVPSGLPVYIFTGNRLAHFNGTRPAVALDLHWKTYPDADTARPDASKTDTAGMSVCIYSDKPGMGAEYVKAALEAIKSQVKSNTRITLANNVQHIPADANFLFWLSESTVPVALKVPLLIYEKGKTVGSLAPVIAGDKINTAAEEVIAGFKMIQHKNSSTRIPVWINGYGETLLEKETTPAPVYHFYGRFDPQWNDLVWGTKFPQLIYELLYNATENKPIITSSAATIDPQQLLPARRTELNTSSKKYLLRQTDLVTVFWILAFIVFFIERILTYRRKKELVYG